MATEWISPTWRMPNDKNQSKFENYGLTFDGSGEYIDCTNDILVTGTTSFSFWFKADNTTQFSTILDISDGTSTNRIWIGLYTGNIWAFAGKASSARKTTLSYSADTWYHIVVNKTASADISDIYVNGVAETLISSGTSFGGSHSGFRIGRQIGYSTPFDGSISQVSVYDYALTSTQISYLYNSGTPQNPMAISGQPPVAYYPLGGSSTGSASTLTVPNESVADATVFDFDGDYIDCTSNSALNITGSITLSCWMKSSNTGANRKLLIKDDGASNRSFQVNTNHASLGPYTYFWLGGGSIKSVSTGTPNQIVDGNWHHVVAVFKSGEYIRMYIDGVEDGNTNVTETTLDSADTSFIIGTNGYGGTVGIDGDVTNTQVWNTALEPTDITTLYNNGVPLLTGTQPQAANLKAWYPMNVDNANWLGSDWQIADATSAYPQSFNFDASDSDIINTPYTLPANTTTFSVSMWVKTTSFSTLQGLIGSQDSSSDGYWVSISSNNINFKINGTTITASTSSLNVNTWFHLVVTYDGSNAKVYLNNGSPVSNSVTETINITANTIIGRLPWAAFYYLTGSISNAQIWDSELTSANVETLYNNGSPLTTAIESSNLKAWYKLDNTATFSTNWSIPDASGNGNTGTSSGMTEQNLVNNNVSVLNGTSSGMTTANLVNSDLTRSIPYSSYSMDFDGASNEYINCGYTALTAISGGSSTLSTPMTISMWFKLGSSSSSRGLLNFGSLGNTYGGFTIRHQSSVLSFLKDSTNLVSGGYTFTDTSSWHHLSFIYDPSDANNCYLYIDSVDTGVSFINVGNIALQNTNLTNRDLIIGAYYGNADTFTGSISNCSIYNKLLTTDEVLTIYNGGVPNSVSSLSPVGWWSLAGDSYYDGTNFILPDLSANSNNGTSANMSGIELVGNGPGSSANGTATNMDIPTNLKGNAPNSSSNAFSVNMDTADRVASVPS